MATRREELRRWGLWRFLYVRVAERLGRMGLRLFVVYLRPHHGESAAHLAKDGIAFKVLDWDELALHARDPELDLSEEFLVDAEKRGDLCVGALDGGRLVAYVWRAFGPTPDLDGMWVRFAAPYRYGYKAFTRPEYRGLHLQGAIAPTTDAMLIERGYTHAISHVELHNYPSRRSSVRHGNAVVGYAGYWRVFGRTWTFASRGAKRHGFAFFDPKDEASTASR